MFRGARQPSILVLECTYRLITFMFETGYFQLFAGYLQISSMHISPRSDAPHRPRPPRASVAQLRASRQTQVSGSGMLLSSAMVPWAFVGA